MKLRGQIVFNGVDINQTDFKALMALVKKHAEQEPQKFAWDLSEVIEVTHPDTEEKAWMKKKDQTALDTLVKEAK